MFNIREMKADDRQDVLEMAKDFYNSDAVDHEVGVDVLSKTFEDAVGKEPSVWGVILCEGEEVIGFSYFTSCYACEVGGKVLILEELYMKESSRGKGYGKKYFQWVFDTYQDIARFRLEVTDANEPAMGLYKKLGFEFLDYRQMIKDRPF